MRNIKNVVAVLLTVTVLIAGAYIPRLVAYIYDWRNDGMPELNPMASFKIDSHKELSSFEKLFMLSKMDLKIEIDENMASLTREKVMEAVHNGLNPYIETQLITYSEKDVQIRPFLLQVQNMPEIQGVVWSVKISGTDSCIDLAVDDLTGKILQINYTAENFQQLFGNFKAEASNVFADIFFSNLDIENYWNFRAEDSKFAFIGENTNAVRFLIGNQQYGEINIDLYVHNYGFYIEFPSIP